MDILLVEDNPDDVELTLHALKDHPVAGNIQVARDGQEALDLLAARVEPPRVVFLDLKLPKIDGLDVLRRIKSNPATQKIPVVILTSSNQDSDIDKSYRLGANSYIVKPVDFERFSQSVKQLGDYWLTLNQAPC